MKKDEKRFDWLPAQMPGVAALMKSRRAADGDAHVNECWRRGVLAGEAGWFFAREGALAVGTPEPNWLKLPELEGVPWSSTSALLILKDAEVKHGA